MNSDNNSRLYFDERDMISKLREEANLLKDCFTKFSFQAMGLSIVGLGAILQLQKTNDYIPLVSVLFVIFMLMVVRIGTHKYESANRILGFELYVWRRTRLIDSEHGWRKSMRSIGWEEALYAWRIIQPTVYRSLYKKYPVVRPTKTTDKFKSAQNWIIPKTYHKFGSAKYEAGSYMRMMFIVLHFFALASCVPLFLKTIELYNREGDKSIPVNNILLVIYAIISIICILYIAIRIVRIRRKRIILESELLSVNACAILWNAVVVAHFRALQSIGADEKSWNVARYEN